MIQISRMADPVSGRRTFIKIESETQKEALEALFYANHFPYEVMPNGDMYIRAHQFEKLIQLLNGIEYELNSTHLQKRRETFNVPLPYH